MKAKAEIEAEKVREKYDFCKRASRKVEIMDFKKQR